MLPMLKLHTNYGYHELFFLGVHVKPLINLSELRTYTKIVPFKEKKIFSHFVVL